MSINAGLAFFIDIIYRMKWVYRFNKNLCENDLEWAF